MGKYHTRGKYGYTYRARPGRLIQLAEYIDIFQVVDRTAFASGLTKFGSRDQIAILAFPVFENEKDYRFSIYVLNALKELTTMIQNRLISTTVGWRYPVKWEKSSKTKGKKAQIDIDLDIGDFNVLKSTSIIKDIVGKKEIRQGVKDARFLKSKLIHNIEALEESVIISVYNTSFIWKFVDEGTSKKGVFLNNYTPHTTPGSFRSNPVGGRNAPMPPGNSRRKYYLSRLLNQYTGEKYKYQGKFKKMLISKYLNGGPGIEARGWSKLIVERFTPIGEDKIKAAINRAIQRAG